MKKWLLALLTLTLLLSLAACGKEKPEATLDPAAKETLAVAPVTPPPTESPTPTEPPPTVTIPPDGVVYYQIRVGSFDTREEAETQLKEVIMLEDNVGAGYAKAYIATYEEKFTVISGTFTEEESAKLVVDDLVKQGVTAADFKTITKEGLAIGSLIPVTPSPTPEEMVTYYQVQAGSFPYRDSAVELRDEIRELEDKIGADYAGAYVTENGELYTVACGTFSLPEHAQTVVDDLVAHGYAAVVAEIQSN